MALYPHRLLCALACWHRFETRLPLAQVLIVQPRGKKSCSSARLQQFWCWATGSKYFGPCPHFLFHKSAGLQLSRACWLQHGCMRLHTSRAGWRMYEMPVTRRVLHCRSSDALEMHADAGYAVRVDLQFAHCQCIHLYCMHAYPEQAASIFSTSSASCLPCNLLPSFRSVCPDATSDVRQMILHAGGVHTDDFMG